MKLTTYIYKEVKINNLIFNIMNDVNKMTCIINIQSMQAKIGVNTSSTNWLIKKSYDELHKEQNSLIEHYNQAINNSK